MKEKNLMRYLAALILSLHSLTAWAAGEAPKCDDSGKIYKVCQDQETLYQESFDRAKAQTKILVVVFGAEWCPWCLSLHKMLNAPEFGGEFAKKYVLSDIGVYQGKQKLESGGKVLTKLKELTRDATALEGIPVLGLVNPKNGKAMLINTEPLEKNTKTQKGHDPKKLIAALEKAAEAVK